MTRRPGSVRGSIPALALRFAGEFLIVVLGVVVALQLEGRYQAAGERGREQEALVALRSDLSETLDRVNEDIVLQSQVTAAQRTIFALAEAEGPLPATDSLHVLLGRAFYYARLEPVDGTWEALVGSGDLQLISNPQIRRGLAGLYSHLGDGFEDEDFANENRVRAIAAASEVVPAFQILDVESRALLGLGPSPAGEGAARVIRDPAYLSALTGTAVPEHLYLEWYLLPVRDQITELLELIDTELAA